MIYPKLVKWTDFWFTKRDHNTNGIPGYSGVNPGWDSGWDNSTVSGGQEENEAPELQAYSSANENPGPHGHPARAKG